MSKVDEIGAWTEAKLDIVRKYAKPYSQILANQVRPSLHHIYIDVFAGAGIYFSKSTHKMVQGSPLNALDIEPPFSEYYFIELDPKKVERLKALVKAKLDVLPGRKVTILQGDCNSLLLSDVFTNIRYGDGKRALCLIDPYSINVDWEVLRQAGQQHSIEILLNFSIFSINRNVVRKTPGSGIASQIERMTKLWGNDSWMDIAFESNPQTNLLGESELIKVNYDNLAQAFSERLRVGAQFRFVSSPVLMCNSKGGPLYYLFFATQNEVGSRIMTHIFKTYREKGYQPCP